MTENVLMLVFKYLGQKMNFKDIRVSAHSYRHTFCHRLAMSGMSAFAIQKLMRHQNIAVTMRYVAMWGNELREQNEEPIRDRKKIEAMKKLFGDSPRDHLLFVIGINTAFRVSDLLTLKYSDVMEN